MGKGVPVKETMNKWEQKGGRTGKKGPVKERYSESNKSTPV